MDLRTVSIFLPRLSHTKIFPSKRQSQQKSFAFDACLNVKEAPMTNNVDTYQTAPIKEQSDLDPQGLLLYLNASLMLDIYLQQTTSADDIFRLHCS